MGEFFCLLRFIPSPLATLEVMIKTKNYSYYSVSTTNIGRTLTRSLKVNLSYLFNKLGLEQGMREGPAAGFLSSAKFLFGVSTCYKY